MCFGSIAENYKDMQCICLEAVVDNSVSFCLLTGSDVSFGKQTQLLWEPYQLRPLNSVNQPQLEPTHCCPHHYRRSAVLVGKWFFQGPAEQQQIYTQ